MKIKVICVWNTESGWVAKFSDPQVKELFGTDTIPTAYTAQASKETVYRAIKAKNPDSYVHVY